MLLLFCDFDLGFDLSDTKDITFELYACGMAVCCRLLKINNNDSLVISDQMCML